MSMTKNQPGFDKIVNEDRELSPVDIMIREIQYQQKIFSEANCKSIIHPKTNKNDTKKIS